MLAGMPAACSLRALVLGLRGNALLGCGAAAGYTSPLLPLRGALPRSGCRPSKLTVSRIFTPSTHPSDDSLPAVRRIGCGLR